MEEENGEAELAVDVFQSQNEIIVQTMIAGVKPEDLDLTIGREMLTIKGKRENEEKVIEENYFIRELYWGKFGRTILLPQEVEPDQSEAVEKHGLLIIKIKKVDKEKKANLKIKSV
jgi:HSP20 family protein